MDVASTEETTSNPPVDSTDNSLINSVLSLFQSWMVQSPDSFLANPPETPPLASDLEDITSVPASQDQGNEQTEATGFVGDSRTVSDLSSQLEPSPFSVATNSVTENALTTAPQNSSSLENLVILDQRVTPFYKLIAEKMGYPKSLQPCKAMRRTRCKLST
jgi:hypothetical protein